MPATNDATLPSLSQRGDIAMFRKFSVGSAVQDTIKAAGVAAAVAVIAAGAAWAESKTWDIKFLKSALEMKVTIYDVHAKTFLKNDVPADKDDLTVKAQTKPDPASKGGSMTHTRYMLVRDGKCWTAQVCTYKDKAEAKYVLIPVGDRKEAGRCVIVGDDPPCPSN
jgi:hypothetical protein